MLPPAARVRSTDDHRDVARRGARGQAGPLTVRVLADSTAPSGAAPRAGVVVPVRVGGAVQRNIVKRRLRHLLADRRTSWPAGARVVVRAESPEAVTDAATLGRHLDAALSRAFRKAGAR